jgi:hypothetical protein
VATRSGHHASPLHWLHPGYILLTARHARLTKRLKRRLICVLQVGNHTVDHPCSCNFDFGVVHLEDMALDDIALTIDLAEQRLDGLIPEQTGSRSFCYPCYQTFVGAGVGKHSYVPVVASRFLAARGGGPGTAGEQGNNAARVDLSEVWGADVAGWSGVQLCGAVDEAIAAGRWLVLVFHGVGGEHGLDVEIEDFKMLVDHLAAQRERVWTDSFINVAKDIQAVRQQKESEQTAKL